MRRAVTAGAVGSEVQARLRVYHIDELLHRLFETVARLWGAEIVAQRFRPLVLEYRLAAPLHGVPELVEELLEELAKLFIKELPSFDPLLSELIVEAGLDLGRGRLELEIGAGTRDAPRYLYIFEADCDAVGWEKLTRFFDSLSHTLWSYAERVVERSLPPGEVMKVEFSGEKSRVFVESRWMLLPYVPRPISLVRELELGGAFERPRVWASVDPSGVTIAPLSVESPGAVKVFGLGVPLALLYRWGENNALLRVNLSALLFRENVVENARSLAECLRLASALLAELGQGFEMVVSNAHALNVLEVEAANEERKTAAQIVVTERGSALRAVQSVFERLGIFEERVRGRGASRRALA